MSPETILLNQSPIPLGSTLSRTLSEPNHNKAQVRKSHTEKSNQIEGILEA
jgi:hypothetical protein